MGRKPTGQGRSMYVPAQLIPTVEKMRDDFKRAHGLGDVALIAKAQNNYNIEQLHEALKGAAVVANHASRRIRELEAALRVARGHVRVVMSSREMEAMAALAERDLKTVDAALGLAQLETNEKKNG